MFTPSKYSLSFGISDARWQASSAITGMWIRRRIYFMSSSCSAGSGCSMNSTPCVSSQLILRTASSLSFQPSLASTRSGFFVTLRTASMVASSVASPTFTFKHGILLGLAGLLLRDLRRIDADRKRGHRRVLGVQPEQRVERDAELLPHPIHQRDIDRRLAGPIARDGFEYLRHDFAVLHRVAREEQIAHAIHRFLRARRILVVAHDGRALPVAGDAAAGVGGVQGVAVLAGLDIVVVQVCCRFRRTILAANAAPAAGCASAGGALTAAATGAADAVIRNLRRFISLSSWRPEVSSSSVVQIVDTHHRRLVRGGVDELAIAQVNARVGDLLR